MSVLFLTSDDFYIQQGSKGPVLSTNIPGVSLILFYSKQCVHCETWIPIFKRLPGAVGSCQFGMINVSNNKKCVLLSRKTIAPIEFVPYIILCINGKPFIRYNGPYKINEISKFIVEVVQTHFNNNNPNNSNNRNTNSNNKNINNNNPNNNNNSNFKKNNKGIPEYTVGKPLFGFGPDDNICYLDFDDAYAKNTNSKAKLKHIQERRKLLSQQAGMG